MDVGKHMFFSCFDEATAALLASAAEVRTYADKEVIFSEGGESDSIFLVIEGHVEIQKRDPSGQEHVIARVGPDDCFGEFGILDGQPRSAAAVASGASVLARLSRAAMIAAFRTTSGEHVLGLVTRIIGKIRESNERYVLDRLRQERMSLVGQMANEIIHDFKNPFTVICLAAGSISRQYKDPQTTRFCAVMEEQIRRMQVMADEVLEFSRGKTELHRDTVDLDVLLNRLEFLNRDYLAEIGVELKIGSHSRMMNVDPDKILRVLQNLVNNAADSFKGKHGVITVRAEDDGPDVRLFVSDTGPGIPPEIQPSLFEAFATFGKKRGLGLGMAITKSIVVAHGGEIAFETEQGKGTTFTIRLPAEPGGGGGA